MQGYINTMSDFLILSGEAVIKSVIDVTVELFDTLALITVSKMC